MTRVAVTKTLAFLQFMLVMYLNQTDLRLLVAEWSKAALRLRIAATSISGYVSG